VTVAYQCGEIPTNHPEAALRPNLDTGSMLLNCGASVPIVGFYDDDGERVQPGDLDLFDRVRVAFGPTPSGHILMVHAGWVRRGQRRPGLAA
jgi:hypothetical protein